MSLARLAPGRSLLEPALRTARALDRLSAQSRAALRAHGSSNGSKRRSRSTCAPLKGSRRRRPTRQVRPACARLRRCWPTPAALLPRKAIAQRDLAPRAGRPPGAAPAARPPRAARRLYPAAAQARRATLARGAACGAHRPADAARCRRPAPRRSTADADPRGAALAYRRLGREWLRIDLADRLASPCAPGPLGWRRRSGRRRAGDLARPRRRAIARLMAEIGFTRAGDAWRWRGHAGRAASDRAARARHAFAELAELKRRREDRPLPPLHPAASRAAPWPRRVIEAGHVRIDGKRVEKAERGGSRRQRRRASAPRPGPRAAASCCCPTGAVRRPRRAPAMRSWALTSASPAT